MITVIVNFPIPRDLTYESYKDKMISTIPRYQNIPGLMRKNYIFNKNLNIGGGVYNFDSLKTAEDLFNNEWKLRVSENFGTPNIMYFETLIQMDNILKTVTVSDD